MGKAVRIKLRVCLRSTPCESINCLSHYLEDARRARCLFFSLWHKAPRGAAVGDYVVVGICADYGRRTKKACLSICASIATSKKPIIISSQLCGPKRTASSGSGLLGLFRELS